MYNNSETPRVSDVKGGTNSGVSQNNQSSLQLVRRHIDALVQCLELDFTVNELTICTAIVDYLADYLRHTAKFAGDESAENRELSYYSQVQVDLLRKAHAAIEQVPVMFHSLLAVYPDVEQEDISI